MELKEAKKIRSLYHDKKMAQKEIASEMGLTQPCISKKMKKYGIKSDFNGFWSQEDEEILVEIYNERSKNEVVSEFPDRSWRAIKQKANNLGLSVSIEEHRNSEELRKILAKNSRERAIKVNFGDVESVSYVLGVVDGDGFNDNDNTVGLEVKNPDFAGKFAENLELIGLNPGRGQRRGKETVWGSSKELVNWINSFDYDSKFEWLVEKGDIWKYIEGVYDSDGDFSSSGPRICSYDESEKRFIKRVYDYLDLKSSVQSNNVYVRVSSVEKFFDNVDPVYEKRRP
ncbi:MAG: hypothetical protein BRC29_00875 [Nanohaloarchaea archaeon SW_7_43_1]|nr:MAG: hypothetical protein BRC29_00875 [Nanohaloarchaea archaeon SW_7_43_1]